MREKFQNFSSRGTVKVKVKKLQRDDPSVPGPLGESIPSCTPPPEWRGSRRKMSRGTAPPLGAPTGAARKNRTRGPTAALRPQRQNQIVSKLAALPDNDERGRKGR